MKTLTNIQGSQPTVPPLEINVDTVYIRTNIKDIRDADHPVLWEYDETQMTYAEYDVYKLRADIDYMAIMMGVVL